MGISASGAQIAYSGGFASPVDFDAGFLIDGTSSFSAFKPFLFFSFYHYSSNTFGANSFIGFRSGNNHYGWLEVTWDSVSKDFEFIKGAFNDVAGEGIEAGRGASAIPEPASVLSTMGMLASGLLIRRRKLAGPTAAASCRQSTVPTGSKLPAVHDSDRQLAAGSPRYQWVPVYLDPAIVAVSASFAGCVLRLGAPPPTQSIGNKRASFWVMFGMISATIKGLQSPHSILVAFGCCRKTPTSQPTNP
jgi:hypothetical protein